MNASVGNALVTADMIGAFADSGVAGYQYFDIPGANNWGMLSGGGDSRPLDTPTPAAYALALWKVMGDRVLPFTQSADPSSLVSVHVTTRGDGSVQLLAVNKT